MLDIRTFQNFIKVLELGSLSRAAEAVGLSQPGLSQQITSLEQFFGVRLLHRTTKGILPTDAGVALQQRCRAILGQFDAACADIARITQNPSGILSVGLPNSIAEILSIPLVDRVKKELSGVDLHIHPLPNNLINDHLVGNRISFALFLGPQENKSLRAFNVGQESMFFLTAPGSPLAEAQTPVRAQEIVGREFALPYRPQRIRLLADAFMAKSACHLTVAAEVDGLSNLLALASSGRYDTILPWSAAFREVLAGRLVARELDQKVTRSISLCLSPSMPLSAAGEAVLRMVVALIPEMIADDAWKGVTLSKQFGMKQIAKFFALSDSLRA